MNFAQQAIAKLVLDLAGRSLTPELVEKLKSGALAKAETAAAGTSNPFDDLVVKVARELAENAALMHTLHVAVVRMLWDMVDDTANQVDDAVVKVVAQALGVKADEYRQ
jgi:uncharacterized tellurite resistance protein B-like protein